MLELTVAVLDNVPVAEVLTVVLFAVWLFSRRAAVAR